MTLVVIATLMLGACDKKKTEEQQAAENSFETLEAIAVLGTCREDHVIPRSENIAKYEGTIERYRDKRDGSMNIYGSVTRVDVLDEKVLEEEATHPNHYYPADTIEFLDQGFDTSGQSWTIHGISNRATEEQEAKDPMMSHGYETTCQLTVTKRGKTYQDVQPEDDKIAPSVPAQ